jgi:uncharacterized membrane protein YqjE
MDSMKLRLILMGCILAAIGIILLILRSYSAPFLGMTVVGLVLATVGVVWKPRKKANSIRRDTE